MKEVTENGHKQERLRNVICGLSQGRAGQHTQVYQGLHQRCSLASVQCDRDLWLPVTSPQSQFGPDEAARMQSPGCFRSGELMISKLSLLYTLHLDFPFGIHLDLDVLSAQLQATALEQCKLSAGHRLKWLQQ